MLARALVAQPGLLLLDEPTNHLDIAAIAWLETFLLDYPGAVVFVTHDRTFLRRLATRIVELDRGRLTSWPGDYDTFLEKKEAWLANEALQHEKFDKKLAEEEAWLRQGVKARRTRNEGRVRALIEMRRERAARRDVVGRVRLGIDAADRSGHVVFDAEHVSFAYGGRPIVDDFSTRIARGDRIGLIGPNGAGKTTLLRLLTGELNPDSGTIERGTNLQIAYFDQQREQLDPERTVADVLARLFTRAANVLILDEPTNDLDLETLELLEEQLVEFPGTILLVSHDRTFLDHIVTSVFAFEGDGRIVEYVGGYEDWERQRTAAVPAPAEMTMATAVTTAKPTRARTANPAKLSFKEKKELEELPARIDAIEAEIGAIEAQLASPDFYRERADTVRDTVARLETLRAEHDAALQRWEELDTRQAGAKTS
jgi:ATP-binding cassette subfamily F protein uup